MIKLPPHVFMPSNAKLLDLNLEENPPLIPPAEIQNNYCSICTKTLLSDFVAIYQNYERKALQKDFVAILQ
jgi:hypothetical protein